MVKKRYWSRGLLAALVLALLIDGGSREVIRTTCCEVSCPGLPEAFSGFRIALVSDLHGEFLEGDTLAKAVEGADLIAVTGDLFDRRTDLSLVAPGMAALCRVAPVYYVSGNHEWIVERRRQVWRAMAAAGVVNLDDAWVTLERQGASLTLAGIRDPGGPADGPAPGEVLSEAPDGFLILLYHRNTNPEQWCALGADLVLSGHGHGGLVRLPLVGGIAGANRTLFPKYDGGIYHLSQTTLVVSRGLGTTPDAPRLFNPPEVLMLTLRPG